MGWLKENGVPTIALETVSGCVSLFEYSFPVPCVGAYEGEKGGDVVTGGKEGEGKGKGKGKEEGKEGEGEGNELSLPFWLMNEENISNNNNNDNQPRALAILIGNERHGISEELVSQCDNVVRIPCIGQKNSLNVGVAFSVCAFEVLRQWGMGGE